MKRKCPYSKTKRPAIDADAQRFLALNAEAFRALGHPARLLILETLRDGERCVCEIGPLLGLRQPNVSQHLSRLKAAGLVTSCRDGMRVMYRVTDPAVCEVIDRMGEVVRRQGEEMAEVVSQSA